MKRRGFLGMMGLAPAATLLAKTAAIETPLPVAVPQAVRGVDNASTMTPARVAQFSNPHKVAKDQIGMGLVQTNTPKARVLDVEAMEALHLPFQSAFKALAMKQG